MGKPTVRPFIAFSILQLEEAFETAAAIQDGRKIREIARELECRSVPKAKKLLRRVSEHIDADKMARRSAREKARVEAGTGRDSTGPAAKPPGAVAASSAPAPDEPDAMPSEPSRALSSSSTSRPPSRQEPVSDPLQRLQVDQAQAARVLDAWILAEVLSPSAQYSQPSQFADGVTTTIVEFSEGEEPSWLSGEGGNPQGGVFYQVILGAIRLDEAGARLFEVYGDAKIDGAAPNGFAPIAILTLDRDGRPVQGLAVTLASFAWALPLAFKREFSDLAGWAQVRQAMLRQVEEMLGAPDGTGQPPPLTVSRLRMLFEHLATGLKLPAELVVGPHFAIRFDRSWRGEHLPDSPSIESLHLADLAAARQRLTGGRAGENLARYLGMKTAPGRTDLRGNDIALAEALAPARIPPGKWAANRSRPLVLLQQAAVNLALDGDESSRLLPINGPSPGTGGSAVLRDLVAGLVIRRAQVMSEISSPREVFSHIGKVRATDGFADRYAINDMLKGLEILVVSSGDAAGAIAAELTGLDAVDGARAELRYFPTVADRLAPSDDRGRRAWGLIAAALGGASDLDRLREAVWGEGEGGLRAYLLEAAGLSQTPKGSEATVQRRSPVVARVERPPDRTEAVSRWQEAQRLFKTRAAEVRARLEVLERGRLALGERVDPETETALQSEIASANTAGQELQALRLELETQAEAVRLASSEAEEAVRDHAAGKPSLLGRLLGSTKRQAWEHAREELESRKAGLAEKLGTLEARIRATRSRQDETAALLARLRHAANEQESRKLSEARAIDEAIALSGLQFVDGAFFDRPDAEVQGDTPWMSAETNRLREDLFSAAMALHRAFVDVAAKPISSNLDLLFRCFSGNAEWTQKMRPLMPDLWATFSCVIPVIATTFEGIERWFGSLEPEALGWLLIDGAGQIPPSTPWVASSARNKPSSLAIPCNSRRCRAFLAA
ncbi:hypothetical protein LMIY3S_03935 [Labrys miyagiensis]